MLLNLLASMTACARDRAGISSLEYAVMALGIVGAVIGAAIALGDDISALFVSLGEYIVDLRFP